MAALSGGPLRGCLTESRGRARHLDPEPFEIRDLRDRPSGRRYVLHVARFVLGEETGLEGVARDATS